MEFIHNLRSRLVKKDFLRVVLPLSFIVFFIFLTNTVHESYPDEFDNILGGWFFLHGKPLYSGFFTHHAPFAYILSGIIEIFTGQSFVKFRILYALILGVFFISSYLFLRKRLGKTRTYFYPFFIIVFGISATYFWGHMLLADSLAAILLVTAYGFFFLKSLFKEKLITQDLIYLSILSSLSFFTAFTYTYLLAFLYIFVLAKFVKDNNLKIISVKIIKPLFILGVPYLVLFIYLFITRSFSDFWYQAIVFNQKFYIYNYPRPEGAPINPIRYAIIIAQAFHNNFSSLLIQIKDFNFNFPFNISLALANTGLVIYLFFKKRFWLASFVVLIICFANARSNPLVSRETDYQSAVYIVISLFNTVFLLPKLYQEINENIEHAKKLIFSALFLVVGLYTFFNLAFLLRFYSYKVYDKYMGTQGLIYDRPNIAPVMNAVVGENEYMWVGPFEFEDLFYSNGKVPSKYIILLPEFAKSPKIIDEMMSDFNNNKPVLIYFDKRQGIRGYRPEVYAGFFLDFLKNNYIVLYDNKISGKQYISKAPVTDKVDLETKLYIRKDKADEIVKKLLDSGYIKEKDTL